MLLMSFNIFFARLIDVTIGTARTILMVRGKKYITMFLAFIEVMIWFYVAREALVTVTDNLLVPISYSAGYAVGNFVGIIITNKFINGYVNIQVITKNNNDLLINTLRNKGYGVSVVDLKKEKTKDKKDLIFIEARKNSLEDVTSIIKKIDKKAFMIVNDTKYVYNGLIK